MSLSIEVRLRKTKDRTVTMRDVFVNGIKAGHFLPVGRAAWAVKCGEKRTRNYFKKCPSTDAAIAWITGTIVYSTAADSASGLTCPHGDLCEKCAVDASTKAPSC
jgi:hypothetical protein